MTAWTVTWGNMPRTTARKVFAATALAVVTTLLLPATALGGPTPAPRLQVTDVRVAPSPFYPLRRDGFRDQTVIRWTIDQAADVRVRIRNGAGRIVRAKGPFSLDEGGWTLPWNGRKDNGRFVKPGRFYVYVVARSDDGADRGGDVVRVRRGR